MRERNVTRAGESIGLSQPATSAALARLRRHYGDELLTREGQHYLLTPLAVSLLDQAEVALRHVEFTFAARPVFDAQSSTREFVVVMSDYATTILGPAVLRLLEKLAPGVSLRIRPMDRAAVDDAHAGLRMVDVMVLPQGFLTDLPSQPLYRDRWVCVADQAAALPDVLTMADLSRLRWVITWNAPTQFTPLDKHLQLLGIDRTVDAVVESFVALPFLLQGTQRVAVLQQRLARTLQAAAGIRLLDLPTPVPDLVEAAWWHPTRASDPGNRWLRELIIEAAATLS